MEERAEDIKYFLDYFGGIDNLKLLLNEEFFLKNDKIYSRLKGILIDYFLNNKNCAQIGEDQEVTSSRINHLLKKGLRGLKSIYEKEKAKKEILERGIPDLSIREMNLSYYTENILIRSGCTNLKDVLTLTQKNFLKISDSGRRNLRELQEWLDSNGLETLKVGNADPKIRNSKKDMCNYIINMCSGKTFTNEEVDKIVCFLKSRVKTGDN